MRRDAPNRTTEGTEYTEPQVADTLSVLRALCGGKSRATHVAAGERSPEFVA